MNIIAKFQVHMTVRHRDMRHLLLKLCELVNFAFDFLSQEIARFTIPQM